MLKFKGYVGVVQFDDEAMIFHGEVIGLRDVITFRGTTPEEIMKEFKISIDGYIDWCKELGQEPEKPFSGEFHLRMNPDLHAKLTIQAKSQGVSLNNYINATLETAAEKGISHISHDIQRPIRSLKRHSHIKRASSRKSKKLLKA